MNGVELQTLLNNGDELFASLERETLACLKNLESMPVKEVEHFLGKRQEILAAIQKFDTALKENFELRGRGGEEGVLEKFRQRQASSLRRVIEADGLLQALAGMELTSLKAKLAEISQGRRALHGYREEGGETPSALKRIA